MQIDNLMDILYVSVHHDDFISTAYEVVDNLEKCPDNIKAVEPIIQLMESNPDVDFGSPGPLVSFVENFGVPSYETILLESLERKPAFYTLWMLNRIINVSGQVDQKRLLAVMCGILERQDVDKEILDQTRDYLEFQVKRNKS